MFLCEFYETSKNTFSTEHLQTTASDLDMLGRDIFHIKISYLTAKMLLIINTNAWKLSVFGVILVRIFLHLDWIRRNTKYCAIVVFFSIPARKWFITWNIWSNKNEQVSQLSTFFNPFAPTALFLTAP